MIIIWSGAGILTPIIVVASFFGTAAALGTIMNPVPIWAASLSLVVSAVLNFMLGKAVEGGESSHSFFFIPVKFWSVLLLILAVVALFVLKEPLPA